MPFNPSRVPLNLPWRIVKLKKKETMKAFDGNTLIPLARDLYLIEGQNSGRFPFCNAFLITGAETVLIDTGVGLEKIQSIDRARRIDRVIISHPHPDHIAGFDLLKDRPLMLPRETGPEVHDLLDLGTRFTGSRQGGEQWVSFVKSMLPVTPLPIPAGRYQNGDILDFGAIRLEALHAPGHLSDHYCFFEHRSKTLLSTDIDFSSFGPWYGNPECAILPFIDGIQKLMDLPYEQVCSSHKPPIKKDAAKAAFDRFLKMFDRQRQKVLELCDPWATLDQMTAASPFYGNRLKGSLVQDVFEKNMIQKNLDLLIQERRVACEEGIYRRIG